MPANTHNGHSCVTARHQADVREATRTAVRARVLLLRSVTEYGCDLPPGSRDRQAGEFSVLAGYRAAPAR
jgi:hypothetical protein